MNWLTAAILASVFLSGCATSASTGSTYQRCGPHAYANADCYGGPP